MSALTWKYVCRCTAGKATLSSLELQKDYTLGTGHVKFFYLLGEYLRRRFEDEIVPEMKRRGYVTNFTSYRIHPAGMNLDYRPTEEAMRINRERIADRLKGSSGYVR